jgi:hypothetical protein
MAQAEQQQFLGFGPVPLDQQHRAIRAAENLRQ